MNKTVFNPNLYDVVFLSYDEPNADENYKNLLSIKPKAKRVHGIKGSDAAHKAVAEIASTDRVTIIDGDNHVLKNVWSKNIYLTNEAALTIDNSVISWSSRNSINDNCYGNGGVKNWPVHLLKSMKTHEASEDSENSIDFDCTNYLQLNEIGSYTFINTTPKQAFRAGFRDGIKLLLSGNKDFEQVNWRNLSRLYNWFNIGADVENGLWAIYGARLGCYMLLNGYDPTNIRDFDTLDNLFKEKSIILILKESLEEECNRLGKLINHRIVKDVIYPEDSMQYKKTYIQPERSPETFIAGKKDPQYDIVFISYDEPNASKNYNKLAERFATNRKVYKVQGITGIHRAHRYASVLATTDYFWVVDADAEILDSFNFEYTVPFHEAQKVRVWRARNIVNGLEYGYGGVKLLPRYSTYHMDMDKPDMTTSISNLYEPIMEVSNITRFNTDPYTSWRSAFRECVKLSSKTIDDSPKTKERLDIWCTVNNNAEHGEFVLDGANEGRKYGELYRGNTIELQKINDYNWLDSLYEQRFQ